MTYQIYPAESHSVARKIGAPRDRNKISSHTRPRCIQEKYCARLIRFREQPPSSPATFRARRFRLRFPKHPRKLRSESYEHYSNQISSRSGWHQPMANRIYGIAARDFWHKGSRLFRVLPRVTKTKASAILSPPFNGLVLIRYVKCIETLEKLRKVSFVISQRIQTAFSSYKGYCEMLIRNCAYQAVIENTTAYINIKYDIFTRYVVPRVPKAVDYDY